MEITDKRQLYYSVRKRVIGNAMGATKVLRVGVGGEDA